MTAIGDNAFCGCSGLTSLTIPNSVTSIDSLAFNGCSSLTSVVSEIEEPFAFGESAFEGISDNCVLTVPRGTRDAYIAAGWTEEVFKGGVVEPDVFATGITLNQETLTLSSAGATTLTATVTPSDATNPAVEWTSSDERVVTVSNEGVVTVVGNGTATVTATTTDGTNLSATCAVRVNLTQFTVPVPHNGGTVDLTVHVSGNEAYLGTKFGAAPCISTDFAGALQIPDTIYFGAMKYPITEFKGMTFFECDKLTSISIPNTVKTICAIAFANCYSLESLYIPMSVTSITPSPFNFTSENNVSTMPVTSIVVDADNTVYDSRNNCNAIIETATSTLIHGCSTTVIPDDIISISSLAFNGVDISSVTIPASVTSIGEYAFYTCGNLTSVVSEIEEPFAFGRDAFADISDNCVLTVPHGTRDAYIAAGWTETVFKGGVVEAKPDQTLELASLPATTYGDAAYTLPAATSEGLALTWTSSDTDVAAISGNTLAVVGAGTATITATQAGNSSYNAFSRDFTLTVAKAPLTITAKSYTIHQDEGIPAFEATYSGFKNGETNSVLTTQPTLTCPATDTETPGSYAITPSGATATNYDISYVSGTLTINDVESVTVSLNAGENKPRSMIGYSSKHALDFTNVKDVRAYIVMGYKWGMTAVLSVRVNIVPPNTGIIIKTDNPGVVVDVPTTTEKYYYSNLLKPMVETQTVQPTDGDYTNFAVGKLTNGEMGFVQLVSPYTNKNKCYLPVLTEYYVTNVDVRARGGYGIEFVDDETTDIRSLMEDALPTTGDYYDLQGRKVKNPASRGIYILNGKKVFVK